MAMWSRGFGVICIVLVLTATTTVVQAADPPSHRNFSESEEDLFAIFSYLQDAKRLSEEALYSSYLANASTLFSQDTSLLFDADKLNVSLEKKSQLERYYRNTQEDISELSDHAESYKYFQEYLNPIKQLSANISRIVTYHSDILVCLTQLVEMIHNQSWDQQDIIEMVQKGYSSIIFCEESIADTEKNLINVSSIFSTDLIEVYLALFKDVLERYTHYFQEVLTLFPSLESELVIFIDHPAVYVSDSIHVIGYFFANNTFVQGQHINLMFNEHFIGKTMTTQNGSFRSDIPIEPFTKPGVYPLYAETQYQGETIKSNSVNISVSLVPTFIELNLSKANFDPNENIKVFGRLTSKDNSVLQDTILCTYGDKEQIIQTNKTGCFNETLIGISSCGQYIFQATFQSNDIYASSASKEVPFSVNYPTFLSLCSNRDQGSIGDIFVLSGRLTNATTNEPLIGKTIVLKLSHITLASVETNETGWYTYTWDTKESASGDIQLYTVFQSDDIALRTCTSPLITIALEPISFTSTTNQFFAFIAEYLIFFMFLLLLLFSLSISLYLKRKQRKMDLMNGKQSSNHFNFPISSNFSGFLSKQTTEEINNIAQSPVFLNKKIINGYRLLLHTLLTRGIPIEKSKTHLEIKELLNQAGFPKDSVGSVTVTFEQARYAPYIAEEDDVRIFDENVFNIITMGGKLDL